jgi:hypothetical protein
VYKYAEYFYFIRKLDSASSSLRKQRAMQYIYFLDIFEKIDIVKIKRYAFFTKYSFKISSKATGIFIFFMLLASIK